MRMLTLLGSLRLTAMILVLFGVAVLLGYYAYLPMSWALAVPMLLFAFNLLAAILTQPVFRRQTALLVFHLALLSLLLLAAVSRLTYLKGGVEVSTGAAFEGELTRIDAGPLHPWHIRDLRFENQGFEVEFLDAMRRGRTLNRVAWMDGAERRSVLIGDNHPLVLENYRFYASPNHGFAPIFEWRGADGSAPVLGTVHLPAYPMLALQQAQDWVLPDGATPIWIKLDFDQSPLAEDRPSMWRPPDPHRLIVRSGERREFLTPGETLGFDSGSLRYLGLNTWMGYVVYYDPSIPWMLASGALAVLSLGWHFWSRFRLRPWQSTAARTPVLNSR